MQVNNGEKAVEQPIFPAEQKVAFSSALEKFQELDKGKAAQQIKKATPIDSSPAAVALVAEMVTAKKQEGPIRIVVNDTPPPAVPLAAVKNSEYSYFKYVVFGAKLEGRQYEIEKKRLLGIVQKNPWYIKHFIPQFQDDKDLALAAVSQVGTLLQWVSSRLQHDKDVVLASLANYPDVYFVELVDRYRLPSGCFFSELSREGQNAYIIINGYIGPKLFSDKDVVLALIQKNYKLYQKASPELKNNPEVMIAALRKDRNAVEFFDPEIWKNREIVLALVQVDGWLLEKASIELQNDKEVALAAFRQCGIAQRFFGPEFWKNREAVMELVGIDGLLLKQASPELRNDKDIVTAAVRQNGLAIQYAGKELKADKDVLLACKY